VDREGDSGVRISKKAKEDFEFYRDTPLDTIGHGDAEDSFISEVASPNGHSALECYFMLDTHGKMGACREPDVFRKALRGKKNVNLQVKMWAEGLNDPLVTDQADLLDYTHKMPRWIFTSAINQAAKDYMGSIGVNSNQLPSGWEHETYVPRRLRVVMFQGIVWLPGMDSFDPMI
jgi:hypothetical protein